MSCETKCLLVTRIGPNSLHHNWIGTPETRRFDVVLSAYDPSVSAAPQEGVLVEHRPGYKVAGYGGFLKDRRAMWRAYDYICFFDEDLDATTEGLNRMFAMCREGQFKIAQAALTPDSHYTYAGLVQQRAWALRHVTFVEMMCPVFRRDVLDQIEHLYHSGHETGIDIVWSQTIDAEPQDLAVLDATPVRHTEPVAGRLEDNGFDRDAGYDAPIQAVLKDYDVSWPSCIPLSAVRRSGGLVTSRLAMIWAALPLFLSVPRQPGWKKRCIYVLVHIKHLAQAALGRRPKRDAPAPVEVEP